MPKLQSFHRGKKEQESVVDFDPASDNFMHPDFHEDLLMERLPLREAKPFEGSGAKVSREEAEKLLPEAREMVRRDPLSPWLHVMTARLLQAAGEQGAEVEAEQAIRTSNSFTAWLPISAYLEGMGMTKPADEAFELGYSDYLKRGNDPASSRA